MTFALRLDTCVLSVVLCACNSQAPASPRVEAAAAPSALVSQPASDLAELDNRRPVPLLPVMAHHQRQSMREHLEAVQAIVTGAANHDFAAIEQAAGKIGYSEQMGQMCRHMGAGAPGFTEKALAFHGAADGIAAAARQRDMNRVLAQLGRTLSECTSCHATYKQQLVAQLPGANDSASRVDGH